MICSYSFSFFFNDTATTEIYTLSLHDALPICSPRRPRVAAAWRSWQVRDCHASPPRATGQRAASPAGRATPSGRLVATTGHRFPSGSTYGTLSRADTKTCAVVQATTQTTTVKPKSLPLNAVVPLNLTTRNSSATILTRYVVIAVTIVACGLCRAARLIAMALT